MAEHFGKRFQALTGNPPFPWQAALYQRFISDRSGNILSSYSPPTCLGKTSVEAVWPIALADAIASIMHMLKRRLPLSGDAVELPNYRLCV